MKNQLSELLQGNPESVFGLHFIATPDTKELMESVRKYVQEMLDISHKNCHGKVRKETISSQVLESYGQFACGEMIPTLESVRGKHVYYFSDPQGCFQEENHVHQSINDKNIHDTFSLLAIDSHGARTTNLVQLCMPYARQDKVTPGKRQPGAFAYMVDNYSKITDKNGYIMALDIHSSATESFFGKTNLMNFYTGWIIEEVIKDLKLKKENIIFSGADQGGDKKVSAIAKEQGLEHIVVTKKRDYSAVNSIEDISIYGDIEGRDVIVHDDMLDTGGTLCTLLEELLKKKPKSINVAISHGMFNGQAIEKLTKTRNASQGIIQNIYVSNSIYKEGLPDFIKTIDTSRLVGNSIMNIYKGYSTDKGDNLDYVNQQQKKEKTPGKYNLDRLLKKLHLRKGK